LYRIILFLSSLLPSTLITINFFIQYLTEPYHRLLFGRFNYQAIYDIVSWKRSKRWVGLICWLLTTWVPRRELIGVNIPFIRLLTSAILAARLPWLQRT